MLIDTTALPQNIQTAIARFEQDKATYVQLQERLGNLHQRLEKHRKSLAATQLQAEQLSAQWREAFRQNDGELTKEIRAMKNGEIDARDFAEEYATLVETLTPEFDQCQIETARMRDKHLESLSRLKNVYADYQLTISAEKLFSLPEAKPFLMALNHKFNEIHSGVENKVLFNQIPYDDVVDSIKIKMEWRLIKDALRSFLVEADSDQIEDGFNQYREEEISSIELKSYSPARAQRLMAHGAPTVQ